MPTDQTTTTRQKVDYSAWTRPGELAGDVLCIHCEDITSNLLIPHHLMTNHGYTLTLEAAAQDADARVAAAREAGIQACIKHVGFLGLTDTDNEYVAFRLRELLAPEAQP